MKQYIVTIPDECELVKIIEPMCPDKKVVIFVSPKNFNEVTLQFTGYTLQEQEVDNE